MRWGVNTSVILSHNTEVGQKMISLPLLHSRGPIEVPCWLAAAPLPPPHPGLVQHLVPLLLVPRDWCIQCQSSWWSSAVAAAGWSFEWRPCFQWICSLLRYKTQALETLSDEATIQLVHNTWWRAHNCVPLWFIWHIPGKSWCKAHCRLDAEGAREAGSCTVLSHPNRCAPGRWLWPPSVLCPLF